jgi:hypothetical protein
MAWTTPKTWTTSEVVDADMLNTHIRDNMEALKSASIVATSTDTTTLVSASSVYTKTIDVGLVYATGKAQIYSSYASSRSGISVHFDVDPNNATSRNYLDNKFYNYSVDSKVSGAVYGNVGNRIRLNTIFLESSNLNMVFENEYTGSTIMGFTINYNLEGVGG